MIESLAGGRPQVLLDVRVYQISSSLVRQLGTQLPSQFTMFNISPALIASLGAGAQNLINQLIASGGINQANSTGHSGAAGATAAIDPKPASVDTLCDLWRRAHPDGPLGNASDHGEFERQRIGRPQPGTRDAAGVAKLAGGAEDRRALSHRECDLRADLQQRRHLPGAGKPVLHRAVSVVQF